MDELKQIVADAVQQALYAGLDDSNELIKVFVTFPDPALSHIRVVTPVGERTFKCLFSEVRGDGE